MPGPRAADWAVILVFESLSSGGHIWRMDLDGSNPVRLTSGTGESFPHCSPDGKSVFYVDMSTTLALWRVSIEGGNAVKLKEGLGSPYFQISPDGMRIACQTAEFLPTFHWVMLVVASDSGEKLSSVGVLPAATGFSWAPDGRALDFIVTQDSVSNLFRLPLTGGPTKQITNFKSGRIFSSAWSPDGKQLSLARGDIGANVVLISSSK